MEGALREAEQRFRTAFDHAPIGVCLLSLDPSDPGRLLQVNPALGEILGSSVEELTGAPVSSLTHPDDHRPVHQARRADRPPQWSHSAREALHAPQRTSRLGADQRGAAR
jgi:PAS domain S-box-containing protein